MTKFSTASLKTYFTCTILFCCMFFVAQQDLRAQGDCVCTNCPQFMPDNFVGDFLINVMGSTNNTLGQNGQGVCGVNINFDHEYLGDLSIVLTSPSGQSVTLVGPIGLFGSTDFTTWDVSFVPCGDAANPDPGFANQWNNNQPWGLFGNYTGAYYPSNGCLENFNSGPVNGTWTLTVTDGQAVDVGNFYNYEIIFCDPSGISCFSCAADGGNLTQGDVAACYGSPNLNLDLPPTYTAPFFAPPVSDYSYTYAVSGAGGILLAYEDGPDLTAYDPGTYTVCGFSYLTSQQSLIPQPDGSLTMVQLNNLLGSNTPPMCGDLSGNCVNVVINASPPNEEEYATVCAPMCYFFYNQTYCQSGTYPRNLLSAQGCPYTATLYLTVLQPTIKNIIETICMGECSSIPGFEGNCESGSYQEIFTNSEGCDSIVNLNLQTLTVVANVTPPGELTCNQPSLQLLGIGSSIGQGVSYLWTASNGGNIVSGTNSINILVNEPGDYQLRVCKTGGGASCCDSAMVTLMASQDPPDAPASIAGSTTICQGQSGTYTTTSVADATNYIWTVPPGVVINSGQNTQSINVTWNSATGGNICAAANNLCGTSTPTCLAVAVSPSITPMLPMGAVSVCAGTTENYSIPPIAGVSAYTWSVSGSGSIVSGQGTTAVVVNWAGSTDTICVNATGTCGVSPDVCLPVTVTAIPASPTLSGPQIACPGQTVDYTVSAIPGATTYQWQITNGTITSGQGSNQVQVTWNNNATSGIVCVNAANICGNSSDNCINVSLSIPMAGQITVNCDSTNQVYTVSFPLSGGTPPYMISGGTISNGVFTSNNIVSGLGYNFVITDTLLCVSSNITGSYNCSCSTNAGTMSLTPLSACEDQTVTALHLGGENLDGNDVASYILHNNSGTSLGAILAQNNTGIFGFSSGLSYETPYYISFVVGNNLAGIPELSDPCLSVAQGQPVIFHENPIANAGVDIDTCGLNVILKASPGSGLGSWSIISIPNGGNLNLSGLQNPNSTANSSIFGTYVLLWTLNNNGCVDADSVLVQYNSAPSAISLLPTCDAANENYNVSFQITGGSPGYTVTGNPSGSQNGIDFVSNPIPNSGNYTYLVTDTVGCTSPPISGTYSCNCASQSGIMDVGLLSTCEGGSISTNYLGGGNLDGNDIGGYFLHTNAGNILGDVISINNTGVFSFQNSMVYGTTYFVSYVVGNELNGIPDTADFCLSVSAGQPIVFFQNPVSAAGIDLQTCSNNLMLDGNNLPNSLGQWSVSGGDDANISINEPGNPLSTVTSTMPGAYSLTWTITQNGCIGNDLVNLQFNPSPILDDLVRTCDASNENYTVNLTVSGGTSPYNVNTNPIVGNSFTSSLLANGQSYTFNITDENGCSMPAIVGAFSCNCTTNAGTMPLPTLKACEGTTITVVANTNQTLDANDITSYVLHNGAGPALGQVYAQNNTGVFSLQAGMNLGDTYYVSIVAGNPLGSNPDPSDPCFSVASGQPVVWLQNPVPNAGVDGAVCGKTVGLQAQNSGFNGVWSLVSGPGNAGFVAPSSANSAVTVTLNGSYVFQWTETNGLCSGSDAVVTNFNETPDLTGLVETCNGTNTQYTISFNATGGTPPYTVLGLAGTFSGAVFTSVQVANNSAYNFTLIDANECAAGGVSGSENCACSTDAGTMQTAPQSFCLNTPATGIWNNDGNTDADDVVRYILHSSAGPTLGTVYATNSQPTFNFGGSLQAGVTYYISAIIGNNVGGMVDLNDPCLSIASGVPVQWKPQPSATLTGDASICAGQSAALSFTGIGTYPLNVVYSNGTTQSNIILSGPQVVTLNITLGDTTTYRLISVSDGSTPVCSASLQDEITLLVHQPVNAGKANEPVSLCTDSNIPIVLANLITGEQLGGKWIETSPVLSLPGAFNDFIGSFQTTGQQAGTYTFRYLLTAPPPCPDDEETVTINLWPTPTADAGENQTIDCDVTSALLGGTGTTDGILYQWSIDSTEIGTSKQLEVLEAGVYTLLAITPAGCKDEDNVTIFVDNLVPIAEKINIKGIRCFGEKNGLIAVDSTTAAHPMVQYSLNGGPFQSNPYFSDLSAGSYTITLMNPNGCESTTSLLNIVQPAAVTAELGADIDVTLSDSVHIKVETSLPLDALDTILWQPLLDTSSVRKADEQHLFPLESWRVKVTVIDSNGCKAYDEVLIRLEKPRNIYVPNVFNPETGQDPILYIFGGKGVVEVESFLIFDRWGTQIFEQKNFFPNDPAHGWDGSYKGEMLNPGVFVYQAKVRFLDGQILLFKGDITLIR